MGSEHIPRGKRIERFSPSLANALIECPSRVAFSQDDRYSFLRRPSLASSLGNVAHAVFDRVLKQPIAAADEAGISSELSEIWTEETSKEQAELIDAWRPAHPPEPEEWPGYQLTRTRTLRRLERRVIDYRLAAQSGKPSMNSVDSERALEDSVSGLYGRPDRVDQTPNGIRLADLKTGLNQHEPTDAQRRQLLLYAVLVQRNFKQWPIALRIESSSGESWPVEYSPQDAERALAEALVAVQDYNQNVDRDGATNNALPSCENCRWCPYRGVCSPYWDALSVEWRHPSVRGEILEFGNTAAGTYLMIRVASPKERQTELVNIRGLSIEVNAVGQQASIVDAALTNDPSVFRGTWSTVVILENA